MAPTTPQQPHSLASQLIGLLFTLGVAAASIFVKNAAHQQTAAKIIDTLGNLLPAVEGIITPPTGNLKGPQ